MHPFTPKTLANKLLPLIILGFYFLEKGKKKSDVYVVTCFKCHLSPVRGKQTQAQFRPKHEHLTTKTATFKNPKVKVLFMFLNLFEEKKKKEKKICLKV